MSIKVEELKTRCMVDDEKRMFEKAIIKEKKFEVKIFSFWEVFCGFMGFMFVLGLLLGDGYESVTEYIMIAVISLFFIGMFFLCRGIVSKGRVVLAFAGKGMVGVVDCTVVSEDNIIDWVSQSSFCIKEELGDFIEGSFKGKQDYNHEFERNGKLRCKLGIIKIPINKGKIYTYTILIPEYYERELSHARK